MTLVSIYADWSTQLPGRLLPRTWKADPTIDAPPRYRRACTYSAFVPDELRSLAVRLDGQLVGLISEAEQSIRRLNDEGGPALDPLARLLLRTESIASSKVEGMQLGVRELARAEARAESGGAPGVTAAEVLANIDAMVLAVDEAAAVERFGVEEIVAIHRRLLERAPHKRIAGKLRTQQNWVGGNDYNPCGAEFVPPPAEQIDRLLVDLCRTINDETLSPLVQAALIHAQFETIHPFDDGNGRTGRALVHVVLRRRAIAPRFLPPISVVFAGARDRYIGGLTTFRGNGVTEWIEDFVTATDRAARLARAYVTAVRALQERWRNQLRASGNAPRADAAAWTIIDILPAHPMISAPVAAAVIRRAKSGVYEAIEQLIAAGVLLPLSEGRRNRWWEAAGLLDLIGDLENGRAPS
ncbi:Fic family protein [soil metagenome]